MIDSYNKLYLLCLIIKLNHLNGIIFVILVSMKIKLVFIISILGLLLWSCRKDELVDYKTIEPLSYFPAYPGSYWVYNNGDTMKVSDFYEPSGSVEYAQNGIKTFLLFPKLLANQTFSTSNIYINEYQFEGSFKWPFLSITDGDVFAVSNYSQGHQRFRKTIKKDTSIVIGNTTYSKVIVVAEFESLCGYGEECYELKYYFAEDVGLIKREYRNWQDSLFYSEFELETFFINQ